MTPDRFTTLADAYGGSIDRWPADEREPARAYLSRAPEHAARVLAGAAGLDAQLACWQVRGPGSVLAARIEAGRGRRRSWRRRLRLLASGIGGAATLAGGVAAGALAVGLLVTPPEQAMSMLYQVSVLGQPMDDVDPDGSAQP